MKAKQLIVFYMKDGKSASSSYYRIIQYTQGIEISNKSRITIRVLAPDSMTKIRYDIIGSQKRAIVQFAVKALYALTIAMRGFFFMMCDALRKPTCTIVLRSLQPHTFVAPVSLAYRFLLQNSRRVVWDFDDDIFCSSEISSGEARLLCNMANTIVVTHTGLSDLLPGDAHDRIALLPTTDGDFASFDLSMWDAERSQSITSELRLVWVASSAGLANLEFVSNKLDEAAVRVKETTGKNVVLTVVCNLPLNHEFEHLSMVYVPWSRSAAIEEIRKAHVGIMPLIDSAFSRGKGAFKVVQYMAGGLPSIASSTGFNSEVVLNGVTGFLINEEESRNGWADALEKLASDSNFWSDMGKAAFKRWESDYSYAVNLEKWQSFILGNDDHDHA